MQIISTYFLAGTYMRHMCLLPTFYGILNPDHDQLSEIAAYLDPLARSEVTTLGLVLGLHFDSIKKLPNENFVNHVFTRWLQEADNVRNKGKTSWKSLVRGLRDQQVRHNGIAQRIAQDHYTADRQVQGTCCILGGNYPCKS